MWYNPTADFFCVLFRWPPQVLRIPAGAIYTIGVNGMLTRADYDKLVDKVVTTERDRLAESLNAVFAQKGHSQEALIDMVAQAVESQPAVAARVVTELLDGLGLLSDAAEAAGGPA